MSFFGHALRAQRFWAAVFLLGGIGLSAPVAASTFYTYTFEQTGFATPTYPGSPGKISGGFTGTLDSFGRISLAGLTDFHLEISGVPLAVVNGSYPAHLSFFDYRPGDNSSFGFVALIDNFGVIPSLQACVGFPVAITCGGGSYLGFLNAGGFELAGSNSSPQLTLVATTPIPAGLPLFATALLGLGVLAGRRRRAPL